MKKEMAFLLFAAIMMFRYAAGQTSGSDSKLVHRVDSINKRIRFLEEKGRKKETSSSIIKQEQEKPVLKDLYGGSKDFNDPGILFYDFSSKRFFYKNQPVSNLNDVKAKYREEFRIKVLNINRYNYNVEFSVDDVEFGSEEPNLFKELFLGSGDYLNNLIDEIKSTEKRETMRQEGSNVSDFMLALKNFLTDYYTLMDKQVEAFSYCPARIQDCISAADKKALFSEIALKLTKLKLIYQKYHEEMVKGLSKLKEKLKASEENLNACKAKKKKLEADRMKENNSKKIAQIDKDIQALGYDSLQKVVNTNSKNKSVADTIIAQTEKSWTVFSRITDEDLMKLTLFNNNFVADHFSYLSPPIYPEGNMIEIGLKFKPSDSSLIKKWNIMPLYSDSLGLNIFVKNKIFVSFSSGPFIGTCKKIRGETYGWQPQPNAQGIITDTATYKLVLTGDGNMPVGIAAFANLGTKVSEGFGVAISPGAGITAEKNPRPVYFLGSSLSFGKKNMFSLTGGFAFVHADQLKSELYPDPGITQYKNTSEIEYSKEMQVGGFISISYTVFSFDKTKSVKSGIKK
jgi:hypothetical protein